MKRSRHLANFLSNNFSLLEQAVNERNSSFRYPIVGTTDVENCSDLRVVILRRISITDREIDIFTDHRSTKILHLRRNPNISLLFYHPIKTIQIRVKAKADIHWRNEIAAATWQNLPVVSRRDYCAIAGPGSPLSKAGDGLPAGWAQKNNIEDTEHGFENFALLRCRFHYLDILQLDPQGHYRAVFQWDSQNWNGQWIVP